MAQNMFPFKAFMLFCPHWLNTSKEVSGVSFDWIRPGKRDNLVELRKPASTASSALRTIFEFVTNNALLWPKGCNNKIKDSNLPTVPGKTFHNLVSTPNLLYYFTSSQHVQQQNSDLVLTKWGNCITSSSWIVLDYLHLERWNETSEFRFRLLTFQYLHSKCIQIYLLFTW